MVDYTKATGSSGTMMIRDTGTVIEFWLKAGSSTFNHDLPWGYTINGVTSGTQYFDFVAGGSWQHLASWTVTTNQTVTFRLGATGTSGLGGPTNFSVNISRSTVPAPPNAPVISQIASTSVYAAFTDNGNGGSPITNHQLGWGTNPAGPTYSMFSTGANTITGLTPGTLYYFWGRAGNALGWSGWGARSSATTSRVPDAPTPVVLTNVAQTSVHAAFTDNGNGGSTILERRVGYGTSPSAPVSYATGNNIDITGLTPGLTYYFWSQVRNSVGWSPLSAVRSTKSLAGAWIKVGTAWVVAIPYVRDGGVWKVARPWSRYAGVWKETS